jgi:hypothetical protein
MKTTQEVEINQELWEQFQVVCEDMDLDADTELAHCVDEYIASLKEEIEG